MPALARNRQMMNEKNQPFQLSVVSIRLVQDAPIYSEIPIKNPEDAVRLIGKYLCDMDREVFCVINLKANGIPLNCHFVSMGALDHTIVHPRELFKASILSNAAAMIGVHNHPSGNLNPSKSDISMTKRLVEVCAIMDIPLYDHIIVGGGHGQFFSFRAEGLISKPYLSQTADIQNPEFSSLQEELLEREDKFRTMNHH